MADHAAATIPATAAQRVEAGRLVVKAQASYTRLMLTRALSVAALGLTVFVLTYNAYSSDKSHFASPVLQFSDQSAAIGIFAGIAIALQVATRDRSNEISIGRALTFETVAYVTGTAIIYTAASGATAALATDKPNLGVAGLTIAIALVVTLVAMDATLATMDVAPLLAANQADRMNESLSRLGDLLRLNTSTAGWATSWVLLGAVPSLVMFIVGIVVTSANGSLLPEGTILILVTLLTLISTLFASLVLPRYLLTTDRLGIAIAVFGASSTGAVLIALVFTQPVLSDGWARLLALTPLVVLPIGTLRMFNKRWFEAAKSSVDAELTDVDDGDTVPVE